MTSPKIGNQTIVNPEHRRAQAASVPLTVPPLRLDDRLHSGSRIFLHHELECAAVGPLGSGHACSFRLSHILSLIPEFQAADHGKHMLRSDISRDPTEQSYPKTGPVRRNTHAIVLKQFCPTRRMVLFSYR